MKQHQSSLFAALGLAVVLAACAGGSASAQVMYNGWNLGPDYGAMLRQQQEIQRQRNVQMQQVSDQVSRQAMQDPVCVNYYRQHQAQGGQMTPLQFGYECARQGRFTPQGRATANAVDARNQAQERQALNGVRQAEANRGAAQSGYMNGFQRNNAEFGNYLGGNNTFVDSRNGQQQVLQHTQPGQPTHDPRTGQTYVMDNLGQYHVRGNDGYWYPMNPMR